MLWQGNSGLHQRKQLKEFMLQRYVQVFSFLTPRRRLGSTWTGAQWGRWLRLLQRSRTLLWGRMRCWQPCRPPDWAGRGKSCAIPGSAEHSGQHSGEQLGLPRWRRQGKEGEEGLTLFDSSWVRSIHTILPPLLLSSSCERPSQISPFYR